MATSPASASSPSNGTAAICTEMLTAVPIMNRAFYRQPSTEYLIMLLYAVVITIGCCGNAVTIFVTFRKAAMRTNRNLFIANLALADFFLCSVTAPITMYTNLHRYWPHGELSCHLINGVQGFNVFLSTLSISAIGLDRFMAVMAPTHFAGVAQRYLIVTILLCVWLLSIVLSAPLYYVSGLKELLPKLNLTQRCGQGVFSCEEMDSHWGDLPISKFTYTIAALAFQYVIPLLTLTFVYSQISGRIRRRLQARTGMAVRATEAPSCGQATGARPTNAPVSLADQRRSNVTSRSRRTHYLLVTIVGVFAGSWFPFNAYTILYMTGMMRLEEGLFAFAHIVGMTSACTNPILYAVLNENFRKEFIEVWTNMRLRFCPCLWSNRNACRFWACSCLTCGDLSQEQIDRVIGRRVTDQPNCRARFYSMPDTHHPGCISNLDGSEMLIKKSARISRKPSEKSMAKRLAYSLDEAPDANVAENRLSNAVANVVATGPPSTAISGNGVVEVANGSVVGNDDEKSEETSSVLL